MLAALGDLVDDIVVRLDGPIRHGADTPALVVRRQGGSAANTAVAAARAHGRSRLIARVGDDAAGAALVADVAAHGVDVSAIDRLGRTGSIVVIVDAAGERTMLTDRGASADLANIDPGALDDVDVLHVPYYSMAGGSIAAAAQQLIELAHDRGIAVSIDVSSTTLWAAVDRGEAWHRIDRLRPTIVFANRHEAALLGVAGAIGDAITVVKHGADPVLAYLPSGDVIAVPAVDLARGVDSTGAGDAFAAGFLTHPSWRSDVDGACRAGHAAAAALLTARVE